MDSPGTGFKPRAPGYGQRVQASFEAQQVMKVIGAELAAVRPGEVEIRFPFSAGLTQQHGFLHAGIITTVVDSACGYAAFTLMPAAAEVLTIEYKMNFIAPARGRQFLARGRVVKPGRVITVCAGEVYALSGAEPKLVATISATMMTMEDRAGITTG